MKAISRYILEKFQITKDSRIPTVIYDIDYVKDLLKATFISIFLNQTTKYISIAKQRIKRSEINWETIYNVMTEFYGHDVDHWSVTDGKGKDHTIISAYLKNGKLDDLINMKIIKICPIKDLCDFANTNETLSGREAFDDWRKFRFGK